MGCTVLIVALTAMTSVGATVSSTAKTEQSATFQKYWGTPLTWKFDDLPTKGEVPKFRVPYSGYIYPDRGGGTASSLQKYDQAFNGGRGLATRFEQQDIDAYKQPRLIFKRLGRVPAWHGHCNGWTAAAMRHAEPKKTVRYNGVEFTPADIKGLLAEIYIYNDVVELAGSTGPVNAGMFHVMLTNWIGRAAHPVAMEADPGEEKWNYPIYAFATSHAKRSNNTVEVRMNIAYAEASDGEFQKSPRIKSTKYFHYLLYLNNQGEIVGGHFYRDSELIDMLWMPLRPKLSGHKGNESGNPYINVDTILAIWRASVPKEEREQWPVIDPPAQDRVAKFKDLKSLEPVQIIQPPRRVSSATSAVR